MKKVFCLTAIFIFITHFTIAQNAEGVKHINEVKLALSKPTGDTNQVLQYIDLCTAYQWINLDSLNYYSEKGLKLAKQLNFYKGEIRILNNKGIALSFRGNIPKAMDVLFAALRIAEKHHYPFETALSLNSLGACYFFLNDSAKSFELIKKAQQINEGIELQPKDLYWKIYIEFWYGTMNTDIGEFDTAEIYLQKALQDANKEGFIDRYSIRPTILMFFGTLYFKKGEIKKSFEYLHQSLANFDSYKDLVGTTDVCLKLAEYFKVTKESDSVIYYAKKGLAAAKSFDYKSGILGNSKLLAEEYRNSDPVQANIYLDMVVEATEALYGSKKIQELQKTLTEEQLHQQQIVEDQKARENRQRQYLFMAGIGILLIIAFILYRNNLNRKKANILLQEQKKEIETTLTKLKATQSQLIQSEKMASLGELTAGIAHEIQNPLNFVNNFSEVSNELLDEMNEELNKGDIEEAKAISSDIRQNLEKINHHGKRAESIVKGMLQHSRSSSGTKELTDINALADEYLRLAYHGIKAKDKSFEATSVTDFDENIGPININPQEIGKAILNLINNAFYAMDEKKKKGVEHYIPMVTLSTRKIDDKVQIRVTDNGIGIPEKAFDKIFQPFFTTKPTGQGTGLGLSISYDIVTKGHGGELKVTSQEGQGAEFTMILDIYGD